MRDGLVGRVVRVLQSLQLMRSSQDLTWIKCPRRNNENYSWNGIFLLRNITLYINAHVWRRGPVMTSLHRVFMARRLWNVRFAYIGLLNRFLNVRVVCVCVCLHFDKKIAVSDISLSLYIMQIRRNGIHGINFGMFISGETLKT